MDAGVEGAVSMNSRVREILEGITNAPLSSFTLDVFKGVGKPSSKWSVSNRLIMVMSGTHDARGFRQWKDANRWVKKGATAIWILAPITVHLKKKMEVKDEDEDEDVDETILIRGFHTIPVFAIENTEGKDLPEPDFANFTVPAEFDSIVEELGLNIVKGEYEGSEYGWYAPQIKTIKIMSPSMETFLHELSHAVDDKLFEMKGSRDENEFVAELGMGIIGSLLGYKISKSNVHEYLNSYGFRDLMKEVQLIERTLKVVEWVVSRTTKATIVATP